MTRLSPAARASAAYALANASPSAWAAARAIDWADNLLVGAAAEDAPPWRAELVARWGAAVEGVWTPSSNTIAVPTVTKLLRKGTNAVPTSRRYIHQQMERATTGPAPPGSTHRLLRDVMRAWALGTHGDPRPVDPAARARLLAMTPPQIFARFIRGRRCPQLYDVLNRFVMGTASEMSAAWRFAAHRPGALCIEVALPVCSYTAILRRVLVPAARGAPANRGVPRGALSAAGGATIAALTVGATAKRVKAAALALSGPDRAAIAAAVAAGAEQSLHPLSREEWAVQQAMPPAEVMWCCRCRVWCVDAGSVEIDLSMPGVGVCGACHGPLAPARLNGARVAGTRMCSCCGAVMSTPGRPRGVVTVCDGCFRARPQRHCVVCGMPAKHSVVAAGPDKLVELWLCVPHHPGPAAIDPVLTTVGQALAAIAKWKQQRPQQPRRWPARC